MRRNTLFYRHIKMDNIIYRCFWSFHIVSSLRNKTGLPSSISDWEETGDHIRSYCIRGERKRVKTLLSLMRSTDNHFHPDHFLCLPFQINFYPWPTSITLFLFFPSKSSEYILRFNYAQVKNSFCEHRYWRNSCTWNWFSKEKKIS